jgi:PAS domain S-box-containing protein
MKGLTRGSNVNAPIMIDEPVDVRSLTDIIDFISDPTFTIDKNGKVTSWNKAMEDLTGIMSKGVIGKGDYEYSLPFYGIRRPILIDLVLVQDKKLESHYDSLIRDGNRIVGETYAPVLGPKGSYLWGKASRIYNSAGQITGAIESIRYITDVKRAEEVLKSYSERLEEIVNDRAAELVKVSRQLEKEINDLRQTEKVLRERENDIQQLVENAPIAIGIHSRTKVELINKKCVELFGYTIEDLPEVDKWWPLAYPNYPGYDPDKMKAEWEAMIEEAILKGTDIKPLERWVTCKDGSTRYVKINSTPIGNKVLITFFDLTEQKKLEEEERKKAADAISWVEFLQRI